MTANMIIIHIKLFKWDVHKSALRNSILARSNGFNCAYFTISHSSVTSHTERRSESTSCLFQRIRDQPYWESNSNIARASMTHEWFPRLNELSHTHTHTPPTCYNTNTINIYLHSRKQHTVLDTHSVDRQQENQIHLRNALPFQTSVSFITSLWSWYVKTCLLQ